ncbi:hypothetical protein Hanom_Chr00s086031g01796671 [Helianthus anomalus]
MIEAKTALATLEEDSCKEMQACEVILADVNRRLMEAEARAAKAKEERDDMATMNANLVADCTWMQNFGVVHVSALSFACSCVSLGIKSPCNYYA